VGLIFSTKKKSSLEAARSRSMAGPMHVPLTSHASLWRNMLQHGPNEERSSPGLLRVQKLSRRVLSVDRSQGTEMVSKKFELTDVFIMQKSLDRFTLIDVDMLDPARSRILRISEEKEK